MRICDGDSTGDSDDDNDDDNDDDKDDKCDEDGAVDILQNDAGMILLCSKSPVNDIELILVAVDDKDNADDNDDDRCDDDDVVDNPDDDLIEISRSCKYSVGNISLAYFLMKQLLRRTLNGEVNKNERTRSEELLAVDDERMTLNDDLNENFLRQQMLYKITLFDVVRRNKKINIHC